MNSKKRKAEVGEKIIITNSQKAWNGDRRNDGMILTVNKVINEGVYTKEIGIGIYVKHDGYEVLTK